MAAGVPEAARRAAARGAVASEEEPERLWEREAGQGLSTTVLVGGFGLPASSYLRPLARRLGARIARLGLNVDCGERSVAKLLSQLEPDSTVIGHSRGGQLALVAAVRRPDLVARLVTVATPWSIGPPDRPGVAAVASGIRWLRRRGVPLMASIECRDGACCEQYRADLLRKPAARWTAIWSSADTVAGEDGRPPATADEVVEVGGSHLGLVNTVPSILP